ncbi:gas vesicle protein GvpA/GvpJ/GvpM family [Actinocorallia herbida]|uniref:Gas vesicle protein A n=1 Tax=Actinocorallia herbida TaxID=58109 RepID=A0A3N1CXY2_9ACTN|nr:gas vesicle protein GvpJ [Actinocorallia herbida]ROO85588.1 gas vesicle protein GvpA/GvpJ/GvpM family [Actinocorallia herbida]
MTVSSYRGAPSPVERAPGGGLADVVALILDKGLVIDAFVRVSLVGIELITIDARVVVASVDTFLRFAEATNRLNLYEEGKGGEGLPELVQDVTEGGTRKVAQSKAHGVIEAAKEAVSDLAPDDEDDREAEYAEMDEERAPAEAGARRRERRRER